MAIVDSVHCLSSSITSRVFETIFSALRRDRPSYPTHRTACVPVLIIVVSCLWNCYLCIRKRWRFTAYNECNGLLAFRFWSKCSIIE